MHKQTHEVQAEQHPSRSQATESRQPTPEECRRRMLQWPNPVEYVNDMYGCHPGEGDSEYFRTVFGDGTDG